MEPMALGSPASPSSSSGVYSNQQQSGAQYLPGYLMGEITSQVSYELDLETGELCLD